MTHHFIPIKDKKLIELMLVNNIKATLKIMTPEERTNLLHTLFDGYCTHCGEVTQNNICYCTRDE